MPGGPRDGDAALLSLRDWLPATPPDDLEAITVTWLPPPPPAAFVGGAAVNLNIAADAVLAGWLPQKPQDPPRQNHQQQNYEQQNLQQKQQQQQQLREQVRPLVLFQHRSFTWAIRIRLSLIGFRSIGAALPNMQSLDTNSELSAPGLCLSWFGSTCYPAAGMDRVAKYSNT